MQGGWANTMPHSRYSISRDTMPLREVGKSNPFHSDTMQFREWNRGYDKAYHENLTKVKKDEQLRERRKDIHGGQVPHV